MAYDFATYQADRAIMEFTPTQLLLPDSVRIRKRRLAMDGDKRDQKAVAAACERLVEWARSGDPPPVPNNKSRPGAKTRSGARRGPQVADQPEQPDLSKPVKLTEEGRQDRQAMLDAQQERHARRRGAYPEVRPRPAG